MYVIKFCCFLKKIELRLNWVHVPWTEMQLSTGQRQVCDSNLERRLAILRDQTRDIKATSQLKIFVLTSLYSVSRRRRYSHALKFVRTSQINSNLRGFYEARAGTQTAWGQTAASGNKVPPPKMLGAVGDFSSYDSPAGCIDLISNQIEGQQGLSHPESSFNFWRLQWILPASLNAFVDW